MSNKKFTVSIETYFMKAYVCIHVDYIQTGLV